MGSLLACHVGGFGLTHGVLCPPVRMEQSGFTALKTLPLPPPRPRLLIPILSWDSGLSGAGVHSLQRRRCGLGAKGTGAPGTGQPGRGLTAALARSRGGPAQTHTEDAHVGSVAQPCPAGGPVASVVAPRGIRTCLLSRVKPKDGSSGHSDPEGGVAPAWLSARCSGSLQGAVSALGGQLGGHPALLPAGRVTCRGVQGLCLARLTHCRTPTFLVG